MEEKLYLLYTGCHGALHPRVPRPVYQASESLKKVFILTRKMCQERTVIEVVNTQEKPT